MKLKHKEKTAVKKNKSSPPFKVLAVDDEEVMGYLIQRVVDYLGYEVDWVRDGKTALQKIKHQQYDVVVSDFRLPGMTGDLFYKKLAHQNAALSRRMIFITGDTVNRHTLSFFKQIKLPYFAKPFDIDALKEAIQKIALSD